jgi:hypothetical protein
VENLISPIEDSDWPWGVDFPGLTQAGAAEVVRLVLGRHPELMADAVDPRDFLILHIDRATVSDLLGELAPDADTAGVRGFRELLEEWLNTVGNDETDPGASA